MDTRQLLRSALPLLGIGVIAAGVFFGAVEALAVAIGGLWGVAHMVSLGKNVVRLTASATDPSAPKGPGRLAASYLLRLGVSAVVLIGLIQFLDPIPLVIGFGLVLLAATVYVGRGGLLVPNPTEGA